MIRKMSANIVALCAAGLIFSATVLVQTAAAQSDSLVQSAQITFVMAEEIAMTKVGGGRVMKIELERDRGQLVYEVEIRHDGRKHEVKINAVNGEIIKFKSKRGG